MPKDYSLNYNRCDQKMHLFAEDIAGRAVRIEGKVDKEFYMKPVLNDDYRQVMAKRNEQASRPKRSIQVVDDVQGGRRIGLMKHMREQDLLNNQKARTIPEEKRERLPKKEVMDMLFRAFERMPHWNFQGLVEQTRQPAVHALGVLVR